MLTLSLRFAFYKTLFIEIYKKCGFMTLSHRNTFIKAEPSDAGRLKVLGYDFDIALSSNPLLIQNRIIILGDICFSSPSKAYIDNFAKKLNSVKSATEIKVNGIITYLEPISDELARYAHSLGVHTLTYYGNPAITRFVSEIELLCGSYKLGGITEEDIEWFKDTFAGYLQGFCSERQFQVKPIFRDGFQIMFMNILKFLDDIDFSLFGFTSGGYLVHLFGTDDAKTILDNETDTVLTLKSKTKSGKPYKALYLQNGNLGFSLTLPSNIKRCTLFKGKHTLKLVTSTLKTENLIIE